MKKNFTSISLSIVLCAGVFNMSAQTNLTIEQKKVIQKEVIPVVFDQLKQQSGIDILSLIQPDKVMDGVLQLPIFTSTTALRADKNMVNIKPDSVKIAVEGMETMGITEIKLSHSDYMDVVFPFEVAGHPVNLQFPQKTSIGGGAMLDVLNIVLNITPVKVTGNILGGVDVFMNIGIETNPPMPLLTLTVSKNADPENYVLNINLDGMRETFNSDFFQSLVVPNLPEGFEIPEVNYTAIVAPELTTGKVSVELYAQPQGKEIVIYIAKSEIYLNPESQMPVQSIKSIGYEEGKATEWVKSFFKMEQKTLQDLVLTIDDYDFKSEAFADSTYDGSTRYTMSDYISVIPNKSLSAGIIERVVSELADERNPTWYKMVVEEIAKDGKTATKEQEVEVIPYYEGDNAIGKIRINDYSNNQIAEQTEVIATASTKSNLITVEVKPVGGKPVATMYYTSNALNFVNNEDAPTATVEDTKVSVLDGGLYVFNCGKASYSVVDIKGSIISAGQINDDNAYISTPYLSKGIYILMINENGKTKSVKFVK